MAALADMIWNKKKNPNRASALMEEDDGDSLAMQDDQDGGSEEGGGSTEEEPAEPPEGGRDYLQQEDSEPTEPQQNVWQESEANPPGTVVRPLSESTEGQAQGQADNDLPSSEAPLSAQATAGAPATTVHRPRPALDAYQKQLASVPAMPKPKLWQQVLAGAAGGLAGYSNAAGTRAAKIDSRPAVRNILYGNYDRQMGNWKAQTGQMEKAADLETHLERTDVMAETARARQKAYEAMEIRAEAMRKREENRVPGLSKDQIETNSRNERAKYAQQQGWSEEKVPGMTQWVATGKFGVAKTAVEPKVPAKYFGMNPTDAAAAAAADNKLAQDRTRSQIRRLDRPSASANGEPKPLSRMQQITSERRLDLDKQNAYYALEFDYKPALKAIWNNRILTPEQKQQQADRLTAEHEQKKNEIELKYAGTLSNITQQEFTPYNYRKGQPANGGQGQQSQEQQQQVTPPPPAPPPSAPVARPSFIPGSVNRGMPTQQAPPPQQQQQQATQASTPGIAPPNNKPKVASQAQIQAFAVKHNMTVDQATRQALHEGFTVLGR